ncbi:MAG: replication initiator A domain-containing protein [Faecalibacterium sp. CAG:74_58_120]|nr:MAG: replication initiator A domain-containing protein [Faecalibacterium sp. CAG:74_58_120]
MTLDYFYGQAGELFSFYRIPKALFQEPRFQSLSTDAKTLYGILLDRMSLSVKNGWLDKQNRVFILFTIEDVKRVLCCADNKATKLLRELEKFGLIERKRRGQGKPSLVYVKNFSAESSKESVKNRDNDDSCGFKIACQDPALFYSEESDGMSKRTQLEEYFSQSLEVELLLRLCPDDEDIIYQIVDLLVDTCATKRKMLRVAGDDRPAEVVRSRFMKLNADHIKFVLKCLAENSSSIRNMKQYLLASLYNAPTTMQLYYQNQTNHDFAKRG